jgi:hypothetical protein
VISVADGWQAFDHVFSYINEVLNPSESLVAEIQAREAVLREKWRLLEQRVGRPSKVEAPQSGQQGQGE